MVASSGAAFDLRRGHDREFRHGVEERQLRTLGVAEPVR